MNSKKREVWLKDYKYTKLAFAESLWSNTNFIKLPIHKPIGESIIKYKIDIYKDIHEIYYGYCKYLEDQFNCQGPVWGRKYTIYYKKQRLVTLQETFSPQITNFFTKK
uniref:Uncharacterized protein n=1 Tax=Hypnea pannosa TaxID=105607 RepID=A0A4D6X0C9_9FLOR|nr:hypothetical protein [Hypnea pannosa]